ncbi:MAG: hypothetical protein ACE5HI_04490, partial [bacterium]
IFEAETVPVEGEGAALGAALHAAWVWLNENGTKTSIEEVVRPFIVFDEQRRRKPLSEHIPIYRIQKRIFSSLSSRIQGQEGENPFELRAELIALLN